ncbi:unnamed protein product [Chrysoparadoxa australica]
MAVLLERYGEWADALGTQIIDWARDGRPEGPTGDWPLAQFRHSFGIALGYLAFVIIGRRVMNFLPSLDGHTYPLRFMYNVVQVMMCSYMCLEAGIIAFRQGYGCLPCAAFDTKSPPVANVLWLFYVSKVLDFMDTVFIVLGKKWNQLSFLHVYHHFTIFLFYWLNLNVGYDGDVFLTIVLNGFIHTVMYTYYFVSLHTKDIWWKSSLTMLQMIQFMTMNAQAAYLIISGCKSYPRRIIWTYTFYIFTLLLLFANFFVQSYMKPKKPRASKKTV